MFKMIGGIAQHCSKLALDTNHSSSSVSSLESTKFRNCMEKATSMLNQQPQ